MKNKIPNLQSSVNLQGEKVTQIITFKGGVKKTFYNILSETIVQGQFTKFFKEDGTMIMINDKNVLYVEIFKEN
tara:strand:+ start:248 stop:469 length:222 start_codon:yes stop_codon:yes gene_type:complete